MTPLDKEVAGWMEGLGFVKSHKHFYSNDGMGFKVTPEQATFFYTAQTNKTAKLTADLAWCLGKLRGLGHPAEHLEAQLNQTKLESKENGKS